MAKSKGKNINEWKRRDEDSVRFPGSVPGEGCLDLRRAGATGRMAGRRLLTIRDHHQAGEIRLY